MNNKTSPGILILGIFAVLFGLLGAYAAKKHLQVVKAPEVATAPLEETRSVPTALMDLPAGRKITNGDLQILQLTNKQIDAMQLTTAWMGRASQIVGRTLREPVTKGQTFDPAVFYPEGTGPSLAGELAAGERAMAIPFEGSAADAGLITPGSQVDVLFRTGDSPEASKSANSDTTVTLLENVRVLAIDRQTLPGALPPGQVAPSGTVTLAVSPVQSRALKIVEGRGSMTLALRNDDDQTPANHNGPHNLDDLLGVQQPKPFTTEIYRRGQLTTVTFHEGERRVHFEDTPYGMPVAKEPRPAVRSEVTQTNVPSTLASLPTAASQPDVAAIRPAAGRRIQRNTFGTLFP